MARELSKSQIPQGWQYGLLDSFAERCSGHTPSKSFSEYWNGGIKWISLADTFRLDKGLVTETDKEISQEGINNSSAQIHPAGTVVLSRDAGIGKSGVMAESMAVSQHFIAWKCDANKKIHNWFLYNWLQFHKPEFERQAVGSTIKTIGLPFFKKLKIALPSYEEQRKIGQILSTWDKAITTTEQLIAASQQQKKALMQQLLTGKKRLLNPEAGKVFEGEWKHYSFGDIAKIKTKKYDPRTEVVSLPCIELEHLSQDTGRILGAANSLELASIKNRFQIGDVLFGKLRPYLRKFARPDFDGVCSTEIWVLKVTSKIMSEYLYQFIQTNIFVSEANKSAGSKMPRADWGVVSELVLKLPSLSEQQKIASVLTAADKEIELLQAKLAHLKQEKKALMQQLLTGKRRVKIEEMEIA